MPAAADAEPGAVPKDVESPERQRSWSIHCQAKIFFLLGRLQKHQPQKIGEKRQDLK